MSRVINGWVRSNGQAELRDNIDTILKDRGSNRSRLARETGLKYNQIAAAYSGQSWLSRELVETVAEHLEVSVDELVGGSIFKEDRERYRDFNYCPGATPPSALDDEVELAEQGYTRAICCICGSLRLTEKLTYTQGEPLHGSTKGRMLADLHCKTCDETTTHAELRVDGNRDHAEKVDRAPTREQLAREDLDKLTERLARFNVRVTYARNWDEEHRAEGYVHVYWWDTRKRRWVIQLDPSTPTRVQVQSAEEIWTYLSSGKHVPNDDSVLGYRPRPSHWDEAVTDLVVDIERFVDVERRRMVADLNDQINAQQGSPTSNDHDEESWT